MNHVSYEERFPGTFGGEDIPQCNPAHHTASELMGGGALQIPGWTSGVPGAISQVQKPSPDLAEINKRLTNIENMVSHIYNALRKK